MKVGWKQPGGRPRLRWVDTLDRVRSYLKQHQLDPKFAQNREGWRKAIMAIDPGEGSVASRTTRGPIDNISFGAPVWHVTTHSVVFRIFFFLMWFDLHCEVPRVARHTAGPPFVPRWKRARSVWLSSVMSNSWTTGPRGAGSAAAGFAAASSSGAGTGGATATALPFLFHRLPSEISRLRPLWMFRKSSGFYSCRLSFLAAMSIIRPLFSMLWTWSITERASGPPAAVVAMWCLGSTTSNNAAAQEGEPLLALCFGVARFLDHSLCFFLHNFDKLVAQINGCASSKSQVFARRGRRSNISAVIPAIVKMQDRCLHVLPKKANCITMHGIKLWNTIQDRIRRSHNLHTFKKRFSKTLHSRYTLLM